MHRLLRRHRIVLLGIGHTNAYVLKQWRMQPRQDAELICVSNNVFASYSGMFPGVLSGQYSLEESQIDLVRLCQSVGARLVLGQIKSIDHEYRELQFEDHPPLAYDWLSIGVGSQPNQQELEIDPGVSILVLKPMQTLLDRLRQHLQGWVHHATQTQGCRLLIVGGGVGGIEVCLCLQQWLKKEFPGTRFNLALAYRGGKLAGGLSNAAEHRLKGVLRDQGIELLGHSEVIRVAKSHVVTRTGEQLPADGVIWATGAVGADWLRGLGLPLDDRGFLRTHANLTCVNHPRIFAVGDCGSIDGQSIPKAGVYAVRQGPVLWDNLGRGLEGRNLVDFKPQKNFLKLVNVGDGTAIADYFGKSWRAGWVWKWKDRIDRRFMQMYQDYTAMPPAMDLGDDEFQQPFCAGCGSKVGSQLLSRVLARLSQATPEQPASSLDKIEDVALVPQTPHAMAAWSVDYFTSPVDEPALAGRIAALHAASDLHAKGLEPEHAVAIIQVPHGDPVEQERYLFESLFGALQELKQMNCRLVGGHTIESERFALGFSMLANVDGDRVRSKSSPQKGDYLIVTKPLGTGILLAAHMRAECRARWWEALLESMLQSNSQAGKIAERLGAHAVTDITGFGLAGHLCEMLSPQQFSAACAVDRIPLLPGVTDLIREGVQSTLAPANRQSETAFRWTGNATLDQLSGELGAAYSSLFDPQTCGGLLISLPPHRINDWISDADACHQSWSCIGQVTDAGAETWVHWSESNDQLPKMPVIR
jgi:selenide,water dikinase